MGHMDIFPGVLLWYPQVSIEVKATSMGESQQMGFEYCLPSADACPV